MALLIVDGVAMQYLCAIMHISYPLTLFVRLYWKSAPCTHCVCFVLFYFFFFFFILLPEWGKLIATGVEQTVMVLAPTALRNKQKLRESV